MVLTQPTIEAHALDEHPSTPPAHRRRPNSLPPGWPLTGAIIGFPLWWLIGVAEIVPLIAGALMAVQLLRMRKVMVRPGFGWWLLFLAWVAVGVFLLQVTAPNAVPDHSNSRYVTYAFRCGWYLTATITLLYVYNMRGPLSSLRLIRAFAWLFVTVVIGGVIGTLRPYIDFPSLIELVLPRRLTHVQYVHDLVHPVMAQLHSVSGVVHPRASAPFAYTNDWGLNYVCLLPFFLVGWLRFGSQRRRIAGLIVLAVSIYPLVMTQNRGAWVALGVTAVVVAVRGWLVGHAKPLIWVLALVAVLGTVLFTTPLGHTVQNRLANGYSDNGRANLGQLTVESVLQKSPVVGLGSTRNVQGAFYSIAGGDTATCSQCTPPALGTQGHFWLVIFSTGVGGLILYLAFIAIQLVNGLRRQSTMATLAVSVLVTHLVTMFFYDTVGIALATIFAAIGLLWRDLAQPSRADLRPDTARDRRLGSYARLVQTNGVLVIVCVALGAGFGYAYGWSRPHQYSAETSLAVPIEQTYPNLPKFSQSLDTVADLIDAGSVRTAIAAAGGPANGSGISVTATPNSQVLHLEYVDRDPARAQRVSAAAAAALDRVRVGLVRTDKDQAVATLQYQDSVMNSLLSSIDAVRHLREGSLLATTRDTLETQLTDDATTISQIEASPVAASTITSSPATRQGTGLTLVGICSGAALGLLIAVLIGFFRDAVGPRTGARNLARSIAGVWVLARLQHESGRSRHSRGASQQIRTAADMLASLGVLFVVAVDDEQQNRDACGRLNRMLGLEPRDAEMPPDRVALLAGPRTRIRHIAATRDRLELHDVSVYGLIITGQRGRRFFRRRGHESRTVTTPGPAPAMQRN